MSMKGSKDKTTTIVIERKHNHLVLRNSEDFVVAWPKVGTDTMLLAMIYQTLRLRLEKLESFSTEMCIEFSIKGKWII